VKEMSRGLRVLLGWARCWLHSLGPTCVFLIPLHRAGQRIVPDAELLPSAPSADIEAMPLSIPRYTLDDLESFPNDGQRYELLAGVLLVTPAPVPAHQVVATRITIALGGAVQGVEGVHVACPGAVYAPPDTGLEPNVLVFGAPAGLPKSWREVREWWLAVEVFSPSSRIYDRDFRRDAYLTLGVREVWLVDLEARRVFVSTPAAREVPVTELLPWHRPEPGVARDIDLGEVFRGVE
jgi:Uma2 family endonuclease